jgi:hypothetical protein
MARFGGTVQQQVNPAYTQWQQTGSQLNQQISVQASRLAELNSITGSTANTQADFNAIGIKNFNLAAMSAQEYANVTEQVKAYQASLVQLAGFTSGQAAAAQNALTNEFMQGTLPAIQKVTQAEDTLMNTILGGEQTFLGFQQSIQGTTAKFVAPSGLADAAKLAGGNLSGLGQQSLAFANTLYSVSIPAAQKMYDALQQQGIGTADLTKVVATSAGEMLQYVGDNVEARTVIVDLINNALGPGTVSLQSLNDWVGKNSTTLQGMNGIIAKSTIAVSGLANVMSGQLDQAMTQAIIQANGGQQAFLNAAAAVKTMHGNISNLIPTATNLANVLLNSLGGNTDRARTKFEKFYEQLGFTKGQADTLWSEIVNKLTPALKNIPTNVHTNITATASGNGMITAHVAGLVGNLAAVQGGGSLVFGASGGRIPGFGGGDTVPAMLEPGETIVPKHLTNMIAPLMKMHGVPGFAAGGIVGMLSAPTGPEVFESVHSDSFISSMSAAVMKQMANAFSKSVQQSFLSFPGVNGPVSGTVLQAAELASVMASQIGWGGAQWAALNAVAMRESGWNMTAVNPTSGAYGIAQFINGPSEYYQYGGNPNTLMGQLTAFFNYIRSRYGNPEGAWAHEVAYGWYDKGGYLMPGLTLAYNGTGMPERVSAGGGEAGVIHNVIQIDGKAVFESTKPYVYQYNARNSGNGNITGIWRP